MAIYDCFQYFNEDHIVDLRLNILDEYVDYFVISESTKTHQGRNKKINFKIDNFPRFKDKIKFIISDYNGEIPKDKHIGGESLIEKYQRNSLQDGLKDASPEDLIILSDSDEIPDLTKIKLIQKGKRFIAFSQRMYTYKLNLLNCNESDWIGSKITKKKYLTSMQNLRDLKFKKYPFWRIDKKNLQIIEGGWHFSYLQTSYEILNKIKSFSHGEFNDGNLSVEEIEKRINNKQDIFGRGYHLKKVELDESFPKYILNNKKKYLKWTL